MVKINLGRVFQSDIAYKDNMYAKEVMDIVLKMGEEEGIVFYPAFFEFRDKNAEYDENAYILGAELSDKVQDRIWRSIAKEMECNLLNKCNGAAYPTIEIDRVTRTLTVKV